MRMTEMAWTRCRDGASTARCVVVIAVLIVFSGVTAACSGGGGDSAITLSQTRIPGTSADRSPETTPTSPPAVDRVDAQEYSAISEGVSGHYFITPSGKWRCAILTAATVAGCQPARNDGASIGVRGEPASVPSAIPGRSARPNAIRVERGGEPEFAYRGQADFWKFPLESTRVLPYGAELEADQFACNVQTSGTSCVDRTTGKGFTFSHTGYEWRYNEVGQQASTEEAVPSPKPGLGGEWVGHGRLLDLRPGGSATVKLASGASNVSTWDARWTEAGAVVTVTFTAETQRFGDGGGNINPGATWTGSVTMAEGVNVLVFTDSPSTYWCREADTGTGVCGA